MPTRQPLQTPNRAEDSANQSLRVMVTPDSLAEQGNSGDLSLTTPLGKPVLTVSQSELTFAKTTPGHQKFLVLTVSQQHANTPVTLTSDAPDFFQLACDTHPSYAPSLTLVPSATGTYVHVRYTAPSLGTHQGQLLIEAPYDNGVVPLKGSTLGILPNLRPLDKRPTNLGSPGSLSGALRIGLLVGISGLALGGYYFRCDLFPSLCSEAAKSQTVQEQAYDQPLPSRSETSVETVAEPTAVIPKAEKDFPAPSSRPLPVDKKLARQPSSSSTVNSQSVTASTEGVSNKTNRNRAASQPEISQRPGVRSQRPSAKNTTEEESELEQELNQKPPREQE